MPFIRLPNSMYDIRINEEGTLKSFDKDIPTPSTYLNKKKYLCSFYKDISGKNPVFRIHRMVGLLFVDVPTRHLNKDISDLQINHIDGDKNNNSYTNLEWVTNEENMKHARDTGLFNNEKVVLVMNDQTKEITKYKTMSLAAKTFNIDHGDFCIHLNQKTAGCLVYKGNRFKYDNDRPWCDIEIHPDIRHDFHRQYKIVATNTITGQRWLFGTIAEAARTLGVNKTAIFNQNARHGIFQSVCRTWIFDIDRENKLSVKQRPVAVRDLTTGEDIIYKSTRVCSRITGVPHAKLVQHLSSYYWGMLPWNNQLFKWGDEETVFPNVGILIPGLNLLGRLINFIIYKEGDPKPYLMANLTDLCKHYGWNRVDLYHHRERIGRDVAFNGLIIKDISNIKVSEMDTYLRGI